jgi:hypothetical protein
MALSSWGNDPSAISFSTLKTLRTRHGRSPLLLPRDPFACGGERMSGTTALVARVLDRAAESPQVDLWRNSRGGKRRPSTRGPARPEHRASLPVCGSLVQPPERDSAQAYKLPKWTSAEWPAPARFRSPSRDKGYTRIRHRPEYRPLSDSLQDRECLRTTAVIVFIPSSLQQN